MLLRPWLAELHFGLTTNRTRLRRPRRTLVTRLSALERRVLPAAVPVGGETRVNSFVTNSQDNSAVAVDADGDYVVAWSSLTQDGSFDGIYAQRFNAQGVAQGGEFRINARTTDIQSKPSVAMDADGDFVIAWTSFGQDGSGDGVFARRYNARGVAQGTEFRVNTYTASSQQLPVVAMDADGDFVVVWMSVQDGSNSGIYGQRFSALGLARGSEFRINTTTLNAQQQPAVDMDADGDFVVTWASLHDPVQGEIYAQRFNAAGVAQGSEFQANTTATGSQNRPTVAMDLNGDFVIAWESNGQDGNLYGVYAQRYDAAGNAVDSEFRVNTYTTGQQRNSSIGMDANGNFVVLWQCNTSQDGSGEGIFGQQYNADGVPRGNEFRINTFTTQHQENASIGMDAEGNWVATWTSYAQDGSHNGIYQQRYDEPTDLASPLVTEVLVNDSALADGARLASLPPSLVVRFSENLSTDGGATGANSVTNPANWQLTRDGVDVSSQIQSIAFALNAATGKYEAVVTFVNPLPVGLYSVSVRGTNAVRDLAGNDLDGDADGVSGGDFTRTFEVRPVQTTGPEFRVNSYTTGSQLGAAVAMDSDGDYVVAWLNYDDDGDPTIVQAKRSSGFEFRVTVDTNFDRGGIDVAMDAAGNFVVVWQSYGQDGFGNGIYARRYNSIGVQQGGEFRVNTYTFQQQRKASVAMDANGDFVVAWESRAQNSTFAGIFAQRFNSSGVAQGAEFAVGTSTVTHRTAPTVAMDADGDFVIAYASYLQDGSDAFIHAKRYDAAGVLQGSEFRVNTATTVLVGGVEAAMDADGDFVITWANYTGTLGQAGINARRYNREGVAQGSIFRANAVSTTRHINPSVAMDRDGDFVVTWTGFDQPGVSEGVLGRRFSGTGVAQGGDFLINTFTSYYQNSSDVAMDADGDFLVAWTSKDQDGYWDGIYAQQFFGRRPQISNQTFAVAENRSMGTNVGTVVASDADMGQTLTYAITAGNPDNKFAIHPTTGQITVNSPTLNYEGTNQYQLTVQVTDNGTPDTLSNQAIMTIHITDLNEAPTFLLPNTFSIAENRPVNQFVGDVNAVDPEQQTLTFSIVGGDPKGQFAINATTGVITVAKSTIDFETQSQYVLQVKAADNGSPANSRTQNITVNVTNLNEAPFFLLPVVFTISENRPAKQFVGDVNAIDPEMQTITFSIVNGDPNSQFEIDPATGVIVVAKPTIDFETRSQYVLQVKATDSGSPVNSRTANITVNITNINEAPVFLAPTSFSIAENSPNSAVVGTVRTVDPEGQAVAYSIVSGNTNDAFAINPSSGRLTVANSAALDFETTPQFQLQVRAQDNGSPANSRTQTITVTLTNVADASQPAARRRPSAAAGALATSQQAVALTPPTFALRPARDPDVSRDAGLLSFWLNELTMPVNKQEADAE